MNLRGKFVTDAAGRFWFRSVKPAGCPIPTDGVVGALLKLQQRHPYRPAHVHILAVKPGYKTLISQVYDSEDPSIAGDAQFGVTRNLTARYERHDSLHPDASDATPPWYELDYTFVMERGVSRLPRAPIE